MAFTCPSHLARVAEDVVKAQFSVLISTMDREELPTLSSSQKRANLSFSISNILHGESNAIRDQDRPPGLSINAKEEHSDADVSEDDELEENTHLRVPQVQRSSAGVEPGSPNFSSLQNQMVSPELTPWLYRPTPLPGYLPLQTSFLTSRFAGTKKEKICFIFYLKCDFFRPNNSKKNRSSIPK